MYNIKIDPTWHTYWFEGRRLTSVSRFIRDFTPVFDTEGQAEKYANKHGLEKEEVLKMWSDKSEKSKKKGIFCHTCVEKFFKDGEILETIDENIFSSDEIDKLYLLLSNLLDNYDIIGIEQVVGDPSNNIAGTYDLLCQHKNTKEYYLIDWKTNNKIELSNSFNKMLDPISYLDSANFIHYSLQLSLLKHCIKADMGIDVHKMAICHISNNIYEIPVDYMEKELKTLFDYKKDKNSFKQFSLI